MIDLRIPRGYHPSDFINWQRVPMIGGDVLLVMRDFLPARRKPVKGGSWKIRRRWGTLRPWVATTDGAAKEFRRSFPTWELAMEWADRMTRLYAQKMDVDDRKLLIRTIYEVEFKPRMHAEIVTSRYYLARS